MSTRNEMIEEGRKRLDILLEMGLWDEVAQKFDEKGTICVSEGRRLVGICGVNYAIDWIPEYNAVKEKFEEEYDCFVYYSLLTQTSFGELLSLLFVPRCEENWENDRRELKEGCPLAYVWNFEEEYGEIGSIGIRMAIGGLVRTK